MCLYFSGRQELILVWNGFKVLHRRPDLVEPMLKLVQTSLAELEETKGKLEAFTRQTKLEKVLFASSNWCVSGTQQQLKEKHWLNFSKSSFSIRFNLLHP